MALSAIALAGARVRVQDAAREAARAAARGDTSRGDEFARLAAPGAALAVSRSGDELVAVVSLRFHPATSLLPAVTITERAVAAAEPTASP